MNDENIKEILDRLKYIVFNEIIDYGEELSLNECKLLLDYITNLQQENERLSKELLKHDELLLRRNCKIMKAIEYINDMLYPIGICVNGSDLPYESIESLLNILQNGSDDND